MNIGRSKRQTASVLMMPTNVPALISQNPLSGSLRPVFASPSTRRQPWVPKTRKARSRYDPRVVAAARAAAAAEPSAPEPEPEPEEVPQPFEVTALDLEPLKKKTLWDEADYAFDLDDSTPSDSDSEYSGPHWTRPDRHFAGVTGGVGGLRRSQSARSLRSARSARGSFMIHHSARGGKGSTASDPVVEPAPRRRRMSRVEMEQQRRDEERQQQLEAHAKLMLGLKTKQQDGKKKGGAAAARQPDVVMGSKRLQQEHSKATQLPDLGDRVHLSALVYDAPDAVPYADDPRRAAIDKQRAEATRQRVAALAGSQNGAGSPSPFVQHLRHVIASGSGSATGAGAATFSPNATLNSQRNASGSVEGSSPAAAAAASVAGGEADANVANSPSMARRNSTTELLRLESNKMPAHAFEPHLGADEVAMLASIARPSRHVRATGADDSFNLAWIANGATGRPVHDTATETAVRNKRKPLYPYGGIRRADLMAHDEQNGAAAPATGKPPLAIPAAIHGGKDLVPAPIVASRAANNSPQPAGDTGSPSRHNDGNGSVIVSLDVSPQGVKLNMAVHSSPAAAATRPADTPVAEAVAAPVVAPAKVGGAADQRPTSRQTASQKEPVGPVTLRAWLQHSRAERDAVLGHKQQGASLARAPFPRLTSPRSVTTALRHGLARADLTAMVSPPPGPATQAQVAALTATSALSSKSPSKAAADGMSSPHRRDSTAESTAAGTTSSVKGGSTAAMMEAARSEARNAAAGRVATLPPAFLEEKLRAQLDARDARLNRIVAEYDSLCVLVTYDDLVAAVHAQVARTELALRLKEMRRRIATGNPDVDGSQSAAAAAANDTYNSTLGAHAAYDSTALKSHHTHVMRLQQRAFEHLLDEEARRVGKLNSHLVAEAEREQRARRDADLRQAERAARKTERSTHAARALALSQQRLEERRDAIEKARAEREVAVQRVALRKRAEVMAAREMAFDREQEREQRVEAARRADEVARLRVEAKNDLIALKLHEREEAKRAMIRRNQVESEQRKLRLRQERERCAADFIALERKLTAAHAANLPPRSLSALS
jgi:hypothetical protein